MEFSRDFFLQKDPLKVSRIEKKALKKLEEAMERPDNCKPIK